MKQPMSNQCPLCKGPMNQGKTTGGFGIWRSGNQRGTSNSMRTVWC